MIKDVEWGGPNREYRYALWRYWDTNLGYVQFIGLNPSTADDKVDDPTIRKCIGFTQRWGFGGLCMTNLFAWRATQPADMKKATDPIGPDNDSFLVSVAETANIVVAAWGNHGTFMDRAVHVRKLVPGMKAIFINKGTGQPKHPLYIRYDTPLMEFS